MTTSSWRPRLVLAVGLFLLAAGAAAPPGAHAHNGGKAVPVIAWTVRETGPFEAEVDLRVRDEDEGEPVRGADVRGVGTIAGSHAMLTSFGPLPEVSPGRYRARVKLPMTASWTVAVTVGGKEVVPRTVRSVVQIDRSALTAAGTSGQASAIAAPIVVGAFRYRVSSTEARDMAVLWVHGIAAMTWIAGIALMLVAVTVGSGSFAQGPRERLARWYRRRGMPLTWAAGIVVVATGIYNTVLVSPFALVWRPDELDRLTAIPFGRTYEAVLLVKLTLFAVMVVAGLIATLQAPARWAVHDMPGGAGAAIRRLGVAGVVFVASVPLILGAVVALRYVHILSHVAEAAGS